MALDINKFSFAQMTSNSDGKTSGSGAMGVLICVIASLVFVYGAWEFHYSGKADIMMYASANILVGAGLLGYRKSQDSKTTATDILSDVVKPEEKPVDQAANPEQQN